MTEEQKFIFDLKGYLLIPEVLTPSEIDEIKDQVDTIRTNPEALPPYERQFPGGASSMLIDHPAIIDILKETLGEIRMESSWFTYRSEGNGGPPPHGGVRNVNPNFSYQCHNGRIYSALTRVVFELNEVKQVKVAHCFYPVVINRTSKSQKRIVMLILHSLKHIVVHLVLQLSSQRTYVILVTLGRIRTIQELQCLIVIILLGVNSTNLRCQNILLMGYHLKSRRFSAMFGFGVREDLTTAKISVMMVDR